MFTSELQDESSESPWRSFAVKRADNCIGEGCGLLALPETKDVHQGHQRRGKQGT